MTETRYRIEQHHLTEKDDKQPITGWMRRNEAASKLVTMKVPDGYSLALVPETDSNNNPPKQIITEN